jgi:hypothetical protein
MTSLILCSMVARPVRVAKPVAHKLDLRSHRG